MSMDDLLTIIDEFDSIIKDDFLSAVESTRSSVEIFISENYPEDIDVIPTESGIDEAVLSELEAQLSQGFEGNLSALQDKAELPIVLLLAIQKLDTENLKTEFIKSEIKIISSESKRAVQIAGTSKKRILETIGLTPNQARSLTTYRQALENIAESNNKAAILDTKIIRYLSASQRSSIRSAIARGMEPGGVDALIAKQQKALLISRAKAIGNSLSSKVAHAAQQAVIDLAVKAKLVKPDHFKRFWTTAHDERVRHSHSQTEAINAGGVNLDQPFKTPFGPVMYPPLEINCRCHVSVWKA